MAVNFHNVAVGDLLTVRKKGPITSGLIARWAAGSGDFNPIHYDKDWALSEGLPTTVIAGPMKAAMLAQYVVDWVGGDLRLVRSLKCRYRGMDLTGDTLTLSGRVVKKDNQTVSLELAVHNQRGELSTSATAEVLLPTSAPYVQDAARR